MVIFGIFFIYPLGYAIYISFYEWGILGKAPGTGNVGAENYRTLFDDPIFRRAIRNTIEFTLVVVPLEMALGC